MSIEWVMYVLASTGAGILTLAVYSWQKIPALGAKMIVVIALVSSLWAFCNAFQASSMNHFEMIQSL